MASMTEAHLSKSSIVLIYSGISVLSLAFLLFYGGIWFGLTFGRGLFLPTSAIAFTMMTMGRLLNCTRREAVLLVIMNVAFDLAAVSLMMNADFSFGRLDYFAFMVLLFLAFVTSGFLPTRKVSQAEYGFIGAFVVSFFFEMFIFPFSLFLINYVIGTGYPLQGRPGLQAAHLWETWGLIDNTMAHSLSAVVIAVGVALVVLGHWRLHSGGKGAIVTGGIYRLRHPQYIGLISIMGGMLIEYPTFPTIALWIGMAIMYVWKARRESQEISLLKKHTMPTPDK